MYWETFIPASFTWSTKTGAPGVSVERLTPQLSSIAVPAKQARAERMERRNPNVGSIAAAGAQKVKNALLHHFRGFIRERYSENGVPRNTLFEQVRHAIRDDTSFAGARTRKDKQRTFGREHGFALAFVQRIQKSHGKVRSTQGKNSI